MKLSVRPSILLNSREYSPLGVNITPRGQISPLGARDDVKNGPLGCQMVHLQKQKYQFENIWEGLGVENMD
jgi:hypothetical protein